MTLWFSIFLLSLVLNEISSNEVSLLSQFSENNAKFATSLYTAVVKDGEVDNVIVSPLSVQICGSVLYTGAAGTSADVMAKGLSLFQNDKTALGSVCQKVLQKHNSEYLQLANKIYLDKDIKIKDEFYATVKNNFFSDAQNVDFSKREETAEILNHWIQNVTQNEIKDLSKKSDFDEEDNMAAMSSIYFKDMWKFSFINTGKKPFWISETESKEMEMMYILEVQMKFTKIDELDAKAVQLDYKNTDTSMLVILPNERTGLKNLEKKISEIDLIDLQSKMNATSVVLEMPKFHIESTVNLKDVFKKMGMELIFENGADFSNMSANRQIKVDKAIQKAFIDVNEVGAEIRGAIGFSSTSVPEYLVADHPFFIAVVSKTAVILTGRFVK